MVERVWAVLPYFKNTIFCTLSMKVRAFVDLKEEGVVVLCVFVISRGGPHDTGALKSFYEFWELNFVVESMLGFAIHRSPICSVITHIAPQFLQYSLFRNYIKHIFQYLLWTL